MGIITYSQITKKPGSFNIACYCENPREISLTPLVAKIHTNINNCLLVLCRSRDEADPRGVMGWLVGAV